MAIRSRKRLIFAFIYLGVLFTGIGWIYLHIRHFKGVMVIPPQRSEKVVVAASGDHEGFAGIQRNMPIDVLPLNNRREAARFLDSRAQYHAAELPFHVRLSAIDILKEYPPQDFLELDTPAEHRQVQWLAGDSFDYDGQSWHMMSIVPWTGLVRHPSGVPTAIVSLAQSDQWKADLLVFDNTWVFPWPDVAMRLELVSSEKAAREDLESALTRFPEGRWGVREGGRMQWISSLLPGSGVILDDGTEWTLITFEAQHAWNATDTTPAILVEKRRGKETEARWVRANMREPENRVLFEYIPALDSVFVLMVWRDGKVLAAAYLEGALTDSKLLDETQTWQPAGFGCQLRLDQVMTEALVVRNEGESVLQAVLKRGDELLRLREGTAEQVGEGRMRYRRAPVPPAVRYTLEFTPLDGGAPSQAQLATGESVTFKGWRFAPSPHVGGGSAAVLKAERTAGGAASLLGIALVVVGSFGLVLVRFRPIH